MATRPEPGRVRPGFQFIDCVFAGLAVLVTCRGGSREHRPSFCRFSSSVLQRPASSVLGIGKSVAVEFLAAYAHPCGTERRGMVSGFPAAGDRRCRVLPGSVMPEM